MRSALLRQNFKNRKKICIEFARVVLKMQSKVEMYSVRFHPFLRAYKHVYFLSSLKTFSILEYALPAYNYSIPCLTFSFKCIRFHLNKNVQCVNSMLYFHHYEKKYIIYCWIRTRIYTKYYSNRKNSILFEVFCIYSFRSFKFFIIIFFGNCKLYCYYF